MIGAARARCLAFAIMAVVLGCQGYDPALVEPIEIPSNVETRALVPFIAGKLEGKTLHKGTVLVDVLPPQPDALFVQTRWGAGRHYMLVRIAFSDREATFRVERTRGGLDKGDGKIHRVAGSVLLHLRREVSDIVESAGVTGLAAEQPRPQVMPSDQALDRFGPGYERRIAVVIGIDDYRRWPPVEGAVRDARMVEQQLGALGFDEVRLLLNEEATRTGILNALGAEIPGVAGREDLVVVFFSGHGQTETLASGGRRGYLVPIEADPERPFATAISMDALRDLGERIPAKHVFFAIDACYSGIGFMRGIRAVSTDAVSELRRKRAVQLITAGTEGQQAAEVDGHGLFTKTIVNGLAGDADSDGDGLVTATELGEYVRPQVSTATEFRQTPQYGTLLGSGEVVFGRE